MLRHILLSSLLLPPAALAQAPAGPTPRAPAPVPRHIAGVSDAGNALLAKAQAAPDPQFSAIIRQRRAAHDQIVIASTGTTIDPDKVQALLAQEDAAQDAYRRRSTERLIAVLRQLPEEDRGPFLRAMVTPVAPQAPRAGTPGG